MEGFSADNLIKPCNVIFSECGLPSKIVSDVGTNLVSEKVKNFCRNVAYNMQYHQHTTMGTIDRQKHISYL